MKTNWYLLFSKDQPSLFFYFWQSKYIFILEMIKVFLKIYEENIKISIPHTEGKNILTLSRTEWMSKIYFLRSMIFVMMTFSEMINPALYSIGAKHPTWTGKSGLYNSKAGKYTDGMDSGLGLIKIWRIATANIDQYFLKFRYFKFFSYHKVYWRIEEYSG